MSNTDIEIVVDDPTAPEADSPAVTSTGVVDVSVSLLLLVLAVTLGWDNWRTGAAWDLTGPQPGYFPFYLSVILGGASLYGIVAAFLSRKEASETFVTRAQLRRVMAVFVPTLLFCLAMQYLGLYVASFLLISAFMRLVGKIALWKSLLTAFMGASNWFVRIPFMAEGLVQGAIGAGLAFGLIFGLKVVLSRFVEDRGAPCGEGSTWSTRTRSPSGSSSCSSAPRSAPSGP